MRFANSFLLFCLAPVVCLTSQARADLPDDRIVHFAIHEDPSNPNSPIDYILSLSISAQEQDGDWIGWQVDNYQITEKATLGSDTIWDVDLPDVGTADGLWWVEHSDPDNPVRADFKAIAPVVDTAVADDPNGDDLEFDVSSGVYTPPQGGDPWEITTALDFTFTVSGEADPSDSGTDEPAEMPDMPKPPSLLPQ